MVNLPPSPDAPQRRVAIVTGAASGIGKSIAIRLAKDFYNVVLSDLASQSERMVEAIKEIRANETNGSSPINGAHSEPVELVNIPCDVTKEDQVQNLVDETVRKFGRLDCIIANAGIAGFELIADISLDSYNAVMNVNAAGTFLCYRIAAKAMIACNTARGGRLIGACSQAGKMGVPLLGAYCASKFAIRALTQTCAREFGAAGITVNAYAPGFVDTPLVRAAGQVYNKTMGITGEEYIQQVVQQSALKRLGDVEDVANLVSFLASDQSGFITGQCISIDGGSNMD